MSTNTSEREHESRRERRPWVGTLLTFLSPGLGPMYVGRLGWGMAWNVLFVAGLAMALAIVTSLEVFPLIPLAVVGLAWLLGAWSVASSVRHTIQEREQPLELESYNHWTVYSAVTLLTYVLPLAVVFVITHQYVWTLQTVSNGAMYPNLLSGDTVLVDRRAFDARSPERGELVAVEREGSPWIVRRIAARADDSIRVEGYTFHVNGQQRPQSRLSSEQLRVSSPLVPTDPFELMAEQNDLRTYAISIVPSARFETGFDSRTLDGNQLYLLADNRSQKAEPLPSGAPIRDSRDFGPVSEDAVRGNPLYVAWSTSQTKGTRWERIGLTLR